MFASTTKILVVDDMAMFRKMVRQSLNDLGFKNHVEATDGAMAWTAIELAHKQNAPFGLIISDWSMPNMKGIDLLKKVRSQPWGAIFPFILLTGEAEKACIVEAIQNNVTQYMIKPFSPDALKQKLQAAYNKVKADSTNVTLIAK